MKKYLWLIFVLISTIYLSGCTGTQMAIGGLQMVADFANLAGPKPLTPSESVRLDKITEEHTINGCTISVNDGLCRAQTGEVHEGKIFFKEKYRWVCYWKDDDKDMEEFNSFLEMNSLKKRIFIIKILDLGPIENPQPQAATPDQQLAQPTSQPTPAHKPKSLSSNF